MPQFWSGVLPSDSRTEAPSVSDWSASQKIVPRAESSMIRPLGAVAVAGVGIDCGEPAASGLVVLSSVAGVLVARLTGSPDIWEAIRA